MSLTAKNEVGERIIIPAGSHIARCYGVIDLGTQYSEKFSWSHKVMIQWELPAELMEDGRPLAISKKYSLSLNEKANLRKDLESWLGRSVTEKEEKDGFPIGSMLGAPCMLSVVHSENNGKTYANVAAVVSVPKGMVVPEQQNPSVMYDIDNGKDSVYEKLPQWIRQVIDSSKEFQGDEPSEQVPFGDEKITDEQMEQLKSIYNERKMSPDEFRAYLKPYGVTLPSGLTSTQADEILGALA